MIEDLILKIEKYGSVDEYMKSEEHNNECINYLTVGKVNLNIGRFEELVKEGE